MVQSKMRVLGLDGQGRLPGGGSLSPGTWEMGRTHCGREEVLWTKVDGIIGAEARKSKMVFEGKYVEELQGSVGLYGQKDRLGQTGETGERARPFPLYPAFLRGGAGSHLCFRESNMVVGSRGGRDGRGGRKVFDLCRNLLLCLNAPSPTTAVARGQEREGQGAKRRPQGSSGSISVQGGRSSAGMKEGGLGLWA